MHHSVCSTKELRIRAMGNKIEKSEESNQKEIKKEKYKEVRKEECKTLTYFYNTTSSNFAET